MAPLDRPEEENLLNALGHPLRREILRAMAVGKPVSPRELSEALRQPLSNVSYHVRELEKLGVIEEIGSRQVRGANQHFYRITEWAREPGQNRLDEIS